MNPNIYNILYPALMIGALVMSVVTHEFSHGWTAWKFGDSTAKNAGRLTFNPLVHIDPFMTIILPIVTFLTMGFPFGGAKPVPVNPYMLTSRNNMLVSLAGPASNLAIALASFVLLVAFYPLLPINSLGWLVLRYAMLINVVLAVFNLVPIPPLDGSHILVYFFPKLEKPFKAIGFAGIMILMLLIISGGLWLILDPIINLSLTALDWAYRLFY